MENIPYDPIMFAPEEILSVAKQHQPRWHFFFKIFLGYLLYIVFCIGVEGYSRKRFGILPENTAHKIKDARETARFYIEQFNARRNRENWFPYKIYFFFSTIGLGLIVLITWGTFLFWKTLKLFKLKFFTLPFYGALFLWLVGGVIINLIVMYPGALAINCFEKGWLN